MSTAGEFHLNRQNFFLPLRIATWDGVDEHFAIIDDELVWNGGMYLMGKEGARDNLLRIKSVHMAEELLELSLGKQK